MWPGVKEGPRPLSPEERLKMARAKLKRATERVEKLGDDLHSAVEWEARCMAEVKAMKGSA
jgi:hypothetical protein